MIAESLKKNVKNIFIDIQYTAKPTKHDSKEFQKRKLSFISELAVLLTTHNTSQNEFKKISTLIVSTLKAPETYFCDKIFSFTNDNPFEYFNTNDCLITIKKISILLKQPSFLSIQQILKNCSTERFFIKLFLKDLLLKNQNFKSYWNLKR